MFYVSLVFLFRVAASDRAPHGTNAKDLQYFVDLIGMSEMEAIVSATKLGGEIMGMPEELGLVKEGYLADLLLVDGDPLDDISVLQDHDKLNVIMKDGGLHKNEAKVMNAADLGEEPRRRSA